MAAKQNINSNYHSNRFNGQNYLPDPTGQLSIPVTFSILISESIFLTRYSPASTLIIPFYKPRIPYGYFIIITLNLITALFVKLSSVPVNGWGLMRNNINQSLPDLNSLRQVYNLPPSTFAVGQSNLNTQNGGLDSPLFPKGLTVNLSLSAPFTDPRSKTSTLFTVELIEIKKVPGYLVAVLTLLLYFILYPSQKAQETNNNNNNQLVPCQP